MLSSVSPEQQEVVDQRLKGPVRFMGPALLGLLRGALPPELTPGSCVKLGDCTAIRKDYWVGSAVLSTYA